MTDTAELIARLKPAWVIDEPVGEAVSIMRSFGGLDAVVDALNRFIVANNALKTEAADALSSLVRERDEAMAKISDKNQTIMRLHCQEADLQAAVKAADAERDEALKVLRDHHKWHAESGALGIPDGDGGWIEMDNGAEYADSRLCQRTEAAISGMSPEVVVPPRGGWSMGSNHWENWQLAYRQKRAAEARATAAEAERDSWRRVSERLEVEKIAAEANAARMRESLKPFEDVSGEGDEDFPDDTKVTVTFGRTTFYALRLGDFRRARNAIGGKDE